MNRQSCESAPHIGAMNYYKQGMRALKDKNWAVVTHHFLLGAPLAEQAVATPYFGVQKTATMIELSTIMHFYAGNYEDVLRIGNITQRGMQRFPRRWERVESLMVRSQNPAEILI